MTRVTPFIDKAEEGCHQDGAEGGDGGEEACEVWIDTVFHHHQFGGELQEGRYGGVEKDTEEGDEPEAGIAQDGTDVAPAELVRGFCGLGDFIGFPDIINRIKDDGKKVGVYPINENSWMDMGQLDELNKMENRLRGK